MTIKDYISSKFAGYGVELSDADLLDICLSSGYEEGAEMNKDSAYKVMVSIAKFIPSLLLRTTSVSESGISFSWDTNGIRDYYAYLCKEYGLEDKLNNKPKITLY